MPPRGTGRRSGSALAALTAVAVGLGHLQAVHAVYVWRLLDVTPGAGEARLAAALEQAPEWLAATAQSCQWALILALLALAWLLGRRVTERLGLLAYTAGVSVLARYLGVKLLTGWPESFRAMDGGFWALGHGVARVGLVMAGAVAAVAVGLILMNVRRRGQA